MTSILILSLLLVCQSLQEDSRPDERAVYKVFDFGEFDPSMWRIVNDTVMGGISNSKFLASSNQSAVFSGILSLENNGGFASVRTMPINLDLSDFSGLEIRVKGDGRFYQLRLRQDAGFDGIAYRADFPTDSNSWKTIRVRFSDFQPTFRGRILSNVPKLDPTRIRQFGFMVADNKQGPFRLEVRSVYAY